MEALRQTLEHTPWWVFLILAYVAWIGIKALRTRVVEFRKLAVAPVIFAVWGLASLFQMFGLNPVALGILAVALIAGGLAGWGISRLGEVQPMGGGKVEVSGSPVTLILVLAIFASKYTLGYWIAVDPAARETMAFVAFDAGVTGVVIGVFLGRFWGLYSRYRAGAAMN